jgi:hypothetical protein
MIRDNAPARILVAALTLGVSVDLLFYGRALGISVLVFALLLVGALFGLGRLEGVLPVRSNLWLVPPLLYFAAMVGVRANPFVTSLNLAAGIMLVALLAYFYAGGRVVMLGVAGYPLVVLKAFGAAITQAVPVLPEAVDMQGIRQRGLPRLAPMLRGLLLGMPVLLVFTCLLASADVIFASYLVSLVQLDFLLSLDEFTARVFIVLFASWLLAGLLAYALRRGPAATSAQGASGAGPQSLSIGFVETATILVLVNALFLVFGWVQVAYLFGGQANITVEGFTYADYARRGFFELVTVSVMTLPLILALQRVTWRETRAQVRALNLLSSLMVGLVLLLLASALQRMLLYEDAYGYTELRLFVKVFETWLAVVFVWLAVTLWIRPRRFAIGCFLGAIGFLVTLNAVNPDALIARQNLARYRQTGQLDVRYLSQLSEDVVPELLPALDYVTDREGRLLRHDLLARLQHMNTQSSWKSAPSFNLSRWEAYALLVKNEALLNPGTAMEERSAVTEAGETTR